MSKTPPKKKKCTCIEQVNKQLEQFNTVLTKAITLNDNMTTGISLIIESEKLDTKKRGTKKTVFPSFCPFCGKKL